MVVVIIDIVWGPGGGFGGPGAGFGGPGGGFSGSRSGGKPLLLLRFRTKKNRTTKTTNRTIKTTKNYKADHLSRPVPSSR